MGEGSVVGANGVGATGVGEWIVVLGGFVVGRCLIWREVVGAALLGDIGVVSGIG